MISDSGWGQGSQSVSQSLSQSVDQAVSDAQRDRFQMEVESSGGSGAAGSSRQRVEGAESRSEVWWEERDMLRRGRAYDGLHGEQGRGQRGERQVHGVDDSGFAR